MSRHRRHDEERHVEELAEHEQARLDWLFSQLERTNPHLGAGCDEEAADSLKSGFRGCRINRFDFAGR
jgi:hypothetical protein